MRLRVTIGSFVLIGLAAAALLAGEETRAASLQSAVTSFDRPTSIAGTIVTGRVLIVHDHDKMAQGGECTSVYRSEEGTRKGKELVSFACVPVERSITQHFRILCVKDAATGTDMMQEYQFGGDPEGHGVPLSR